MALPGTPSTSDPKKHGATVWNILDHAVTVISLIAGVAVVVAAASVYRDRAPKAPPPRPVPTSPVSLELAKTRGSASAPIVMIVFSDFQCPFCRLFDQNVLPQLVDRYVTPGKVELAYIQFPLAQIHPLATQAARLALCADAQGRYWPMHQQLLQQPELVKQEMDRLPSAVGLDSTKLDACLRGPDASAQLARDIDLGVALNVVGTPTFFVGQRTGANDVKVQSRFGALSFEEMVGRLRDAGVERY